MMKNNPKAMQTNLIKDHTIVQDHWITLTADNPIHQADQKHIIVPLDLWKAQKSELIQSEKTLGLLIPNTTELTEVADAFTVVKLIAIDFPVFTDGRGYSLARIIREAGYKQELRAVGDILKDQLFYLSRSGFNAFELRSDQNIEIAIKGLSDFSISYQ